MRTTPFGTLWMTGRIAAQVNEKLGFSGFAHFSTFSYAVFTSLMQMLISKLIPGSLICETNVWFGIDSQIVLQRRPP